MTKLYITHAKSTDIIIVEPIKQSPHNFWLEEDQAAQTYMLNTGKNSKTHYNRSCFTTFEAAKEHIIAEYTDRVRVFEARLEDIKQDIELVKQLEETK